MAGLGQSEEYEPQCAFGSCTYGKEHLCKGDNVERDAHGQDDGSCAERKALQPLFDFVHDTMVLLPLAKELLIIEQAAVAVGEEAEVVAQGVVVDGAPLPIDKG